VRATLRVFLATNGSYQAMWKVAVLADPGNHGSGSREFRALRPTDDKFSGAADDDQG
jgi:hypothetical protein